MSNSVEYTAWPLPEKLTRKVVSYLDIYRLIITLILGAAHFATLPAIPELGSSASVASIVLVLYFLAAIFYLVKGRDNQTDFYQLAQVSLFTDVVFLGLLVIFLSGIEGGLGILQCPLANGDLVTCQIVFENHFRCFNQAAFRLEL